MRPLPGKPPKPKVEDQMPGYINCTAPSLSEKELEDEAVDKAVDEAAYLLIPL